MRPPLYYYLCLDRILLSPFTYIDAKIRKTSRGYCPTFEIIAFKTAKLDVFDTLQSTGRLSALSEQSTRLKELIY